MLPNAAFLLDVEVLLRILSLLFGPFCLIFKFQIFFSSFVSTFFVSVVNNCCYSYG